MQKLIGIALVLAMSLLPVRTFAAAGDLDPSFGTGGLVQTPFPGGGGDSIAAMTILSSGKILAVGGSINAGGTLDSSMVRYNSDGSIDTSFATAGFLTQDFAPGLDDAFSGVAIDSANRIVAVGAVETAVDADLYVARFTENGTLDTSFGAGGKTVVPIPGTFESVAGVSLTSDQRIVTGGFTGGKFFAVKFDANGVLDTGFDGDGLVSTDLAAGNDFGRFSTLQPDGKVVVAGENQGATDFAVVRYNTDGSLDTTFDADGVVLSNLTTIDAAEAVLLQPDGKLLVCGRGNLGANHLFLVARYHSNGSLDTTFDTDGFQTADIAAGQDIADSLALQADGKVIAAGESGGFGVIRLNADGAFDTSFSGDGKFQAAFGTPGAAANAVAVASDGKIVVAGTDGNDFTLLRLKGDASDLKLELSSSSSSLSVGEDATVTLTVTNLGAVPVGGVTVAGTLPSQLTLQSATPSAGSCDVASATCSLGTLAAGGTAQVTVVLRGAVAGSAPVSVTVSGQVEDTDATNNTASATLTVNEASGGGGAGGTSSVCGNGTVETGETCDDGNTTDGDGCSATCATESAGTTSSGGCSLVTSTSRSEHRAAGSGLVR